MNSFLKWLFLKNVKVRKGFKFAIGLRIDHYIMITGFHLLRFNISGINDYFCAYTPKLLYL